MYHMRKEAIIPFDPNIRSSCACYNMKRYKSSWESPVANALYQWSYSVSNALSLIRQTLHILASHQDSFIHHTKYLTSQSKISDVQNLLFIIRYKHPLAKPGTKAYSIHWKIYPPTPSARKHLYIMFYINNSLTFNLSNWTFSRKMNPTKDFKVFRFYQQSSIYVPQVRS
jgi:hypothetical protein